MSDSPDIQIHAPVCPDVAGDEEAASMEAAWVVPVPALRPPPGFEAFSWPQAEWGTDGEAQRHCLTFHTSSPAGFLGYMGASRLIHRCYRFRQYYGIASEVTVLGDDPVMSDSPDIQIHAPVCPDVAGDEEADSMEAARVVPVPALRPHIFLGDMGASRLVHRHHRFRQYFGIAWTTLLSLMWGRLGRSQPLHWRLLLWRPPW